MTQSVTSMPVWAIASAIFMKISLYNANGHADSVVSIHYHCLNFIIIIDLVFVHNF